MKLTELDATFVRYTGKGCHQDVTTIGEATGVCFLCPKCFQRSGGGVGVHSVLVWFKGTPLDAVPGPARWSVAGTSLEDLTLSPSIDLTRGGLSDDWHGFIKDGLAS